ncbi:MAG: hypothetical protein FWC71_08050 [Defluviitaleaceae bacterium]|nr:hypothetical protein [Defluviitaleaceae bacterium]
MRKVQNRKLRNREIERKKKNRATLAAIIMASIAVLFVAIIAWTAWDNQSRRWIINFAGERVATNEVRAFLNPDPSEAEIDHIIDIFIANMTLLQVAESHGIYLTEEDLLTGSMWANLLFEDAPEHAANERIIEILAVEFGDIIGQLTDLYVPESLAVLNINEDEHQALADAHVQDNWYQFLTLETFVLLTEYEDEMTEWYARIQSGEATFEELVREANADWLEDDQETPLVGIGTVIHQLMFDDEHANMFFTMQEGEMSDIIVWGLETDIGQDLYMLLYVVEREEPNEETIRREFREATVSSARNAMMGELLDQWIEDADYTINRRAINRI